MKRINQMVGRMTAGVTVVFFWAGHALAATPPPGMTSVIGTNGQSGTSIFTLIEKVLTYVVGAAEIVIGGYILFQFYLAIIGFMKGGQNAQRREEAKVHLIHVGIATVLAGAGGIFLGALYAFGKGL